MCFVSNVQEPKTVMARKYTAATRKFSGGRVAVKPGVAAIPYSDTYKVGLVTGLCETKIERSEPERCVALLVWRRGANVLTQ